MKKFLLTLLALLPLNVEAASYRVLTPEILFEEQIGLTRRDESTGATVTALATTKSFIKVTGTVTLIQGAVAPTSPVSRMIIVANQSGSSVTIAHQAGAATAINRFVLAGAADLQVTPGASAMFLYDHGQSRWVLAGTGGSAGVSVSDTNSVDLTLTGADIEADLKLSDDVADAGHINSVVEIETDGLHVQVPIADTNTTGVLTDTAFDTFTQAGVDATQALSDASDAQDDIDAHIADATAAHTGTAISNTPAGNLAATTVQGALNELQTESDGQATAISNAQSDATQALSDASDAQDDIDAHIADTTDAHAGTAITNTPAGNLAATTVQGALNELQTDVDGRQPADADLTALAALSTTGMLARTGAATYVPRTIASTAPISVSNGDGVSGAPSITCAVASGSQPGCLASADFTTFNDKQAGPLTGDVTTSGAAATIANDAVTNAKSANMAQSTIKGRAVSAGTGDPTDLSATQATAILDPMVGDSGSGGTKGLAPAPGAGDAAAGKFLKADGTYAVPPGTSAGITEPFCPDVDTCVNVTSTTEGFFTVPAGVTCLDIHAVGGAGGGGHDSGSNIGGGGGAGAKVRRVRSYAVHPGQVIPYKVGTGGAAGVTGGKGGQGKRTFFGSIVADYGDSGAGNNAGPGVGGGGFISFAMVDFDYTSATASTAFSDSGYFKGSQGGNYPAQGVGGGGAGACEDGQPYVALSKGGDGGDGCPYEDPLGIDAVTYFGAGAGGGGYLGCGGDGGAGGGSRGGDNCGAAGSARNATTPTANSGSAGGGSSVGGATAAPGAAGRIRYCYKS